MLPGHISILPLIRFYKGAEKKGIFIHELMTMRIDRTFWVSSLITSKFKTICLPTSHNVVYSSELPPLDPVPLQDSSAHFAAAGSPDSTAGSKLTCSLEISLKENQPVGSSRHPLTVQCGTIQKSHDRSRAPCAIC